MLVCSRLTLAPRHLFRRASVTRICSTYDRGFCNCNPNSGGSQQSSSSPSAFDWKCRPTWRSASVNTAWCLLGCSIGEFVVNGLITSVALETVILHKGTAQMPLRTAFHTATGMSFISMCMMEFAMELSDFCLTGGTFAFQLWLVPPVLVSGFLAALPYNYWRLKKYGKACH